MHIDSEKALHDTPVGGFIKIQSPEQFVPMYLATRIEKPQDYVQWINGDTCIVMPNAKARQLEDTVQIIINPDTTKTQKKLKYNKILNLIKESLTEQLSCTYPKEYSFASDQKSYLYSGSFSQHNNILGSLYQFQVCRARYTSYNLIDYLLLVSATTRYGYVPIRTPLYPNLTSSFSSLPEKFEPLILGIVKAKHIPVLRASYYLGLPMPPIPEGDIKVLYNSVGTSFDSFNYIWSNRGNNFSSFHVLTNGLESLLHKMGIPTQVALGAEMKSYLISETFGQKKPSKEQIYACWSKLISAKKAGEVTRAEIW